MKSTMHRPIRTLAITATVAFAVMGACADAEARGSASPRAMRKEAEAMQREMPRAWDALQEKRRASEDAQARLDRARSASDAETHAEATKRLTDAGKHLEKGIANELGHAGRSTAKSKAESARHAAEATVDIAAAKDAYENNARDDIALMDGSLRADAEAKHAEYTKALAEYEAKHSAIEALKAQADEKAKRQPNSIASLIQFATREAKRAAEKAAAEKAAAEAARDRQTWDKFHRDIQHRDPVKDSRDTHNFDKMIKAGKTG